jgi:2-oxoisovalerate dehydrogenase E1 component alpha subunit
VLIVVENNHWGISTAEETQHGEHHIIDRGKAFGILGEVVDGNDPIASWHGLARAMKYVREKRRPFMLEAFVSRLHGHSSSSGAARVKEEPCCLDMFGKKLLAAGVLDAATLEHIRADARHEADSAAEQAVKEPMPTPEDVYKHTYAASPVDVVYPGDYTGLPR